MVADQPKISAEPKYGSDKTTQSRTTETGIKKGVALIHIKTTPNQNLNYEKNVAEARLELTTFGL